MTVVNTRRLRLSICASPPDAACDYLLAPWLADFPREVREFLPLLPVVDLNGRTLQALSKPTALVPRPIVGLMLADPFLRVRDVRPLLARAGIDRVANFPTVQLVDGDAARALDSADLGAAREAAALSAFQSACVEAVAFARDLAGARLMLAIRPALLVLHPGVALSDWRQRASAAVALLKSARALRGELACPLLVYRPFGFGSELDAAVAEADGEAGVVENIDRN